MTAHPPERAGDTERDAEWRRNWAWFVAAEEADCKRGAAEVRALLTDIATLLSGWHQDGTAWSAWDQTVYDRVRAALHGVAGWPALATPPDTKSAAPHVDEAARIRRLVESFEQKVQDLANETARSSTLHDSVKRLERDKSNADHLVRAILRNVTSADLPTEVWDALKAYDETLTIEDVRTAPPREAEGVSEAMIEAALRSRFGPNWPLAFDHVHRIELRDGMRSDLLAALRAS